MSHRYPVRLPVAAVDVGTPVDRFLRRRLAADPPHVRKLLRQKRVRFAAAPAETPPEGEAGPAPPAILSHGDVLVAPGEIDVLAGPTERRPPAPNRKLRPRVLFSDQDLAVVDKPAGIAMHPGPRHGSDTLLNGLIARYPELAQLGSDRSFGLVHRLDLETSGLLVVARSVLAYDGLVEQFKSRTIEKRYLALVRVGPDGLRLGAVKKPVAGKFALTEIESCEPAGDGAEVALVRCRPVTGRMHQIRIHLAARRCPVLFDKRHGSGPDEQTAKLYLKRLALHAAELGFAHPRSGKTLRFERAFPRDLRHSWRRAQKLWGGASLTPEVSETDSQAEPVPEDQASSPSPDADGRPAPTAD